MSRLAIASDEVIAPGSEFHNLLIQMNIHPDRQTFIVGCRRGPELLAELHSTGCEFVLLAGVNSLRAIRPDLSTRRACGIPFWISSDEREWGAVATVSPEALQRNPAWGSSVKTHLEALKKFAISPEDQLQMVPSSCIRCGAEGKHLDDSLLWLCGACVENDGVALVHKTFPDK